VSFPKLIQNYLLQLSIFKEGFEYQTLLLKLGRQFEILPRSTCQSCAAQSVRLIGNRTRYLLSYRQQATNQLLYRRLTELCVSLRKTEFRKQARLNRAEQRGAKFSASLLRGRRLTF